MGLYNRANKYLAKKPKQRKTIETMTKKELVKVLDKVFSEYIRLDEATDYGYVNCFTCGAGHRWKDIDCGHFIPRAREATRYDPMNCKPQCKRCNRFRSGEHDIFRHGLIEVHGKEAIEQMEQKARLGGSYDAYQLREMIIEYREKVKRLRKEKCL